MVYRKAVILALVIGIALTITASATLAQAGGGGRGGRFDPAQWQERWNTEMKQALSVTDEEWTAIQPLVEKVQTLNREAMQMRFGRIGRGTRRGPGGDQGTENTEQTLSPLAQAFQDLQTALENPNATSDEIKAKLTAYRDAREKSKQELETAKAALRDVVTVRQEAVLVTRGILD